MVVIEMREAAQERALDLVDELHELGHEKKMILCELEDTLYDCFETPKDEKEEGSDEGTDLGFKRRYAMRNFNEDEDRDTEKVHHYRRMRMRRNRMGRYV
jgi:hypothetical protein